MLFLMGNTPQIWRCNSHFPLRASSESELEESLGSQESRKHFKRLSFNRLQPSMIECSPSEEGHLWVIS